MKRCNRCGIPEEKWKSDMVCYECKKSYCIIRNEDIIDTRIFTYADRYGFLISGQFSAPFFSSCVIKLKNETSRKIPQYVLNFVKQYE